MNRILTTTALALLPLGFAGTAAAQCLPDTPADGASVTCAADDMDGFAVPDLDDITMTIGAGVTVSNTDADAVEADDDLSVTNNGTVAGLGTDADGIGADNDLTVTNSGTISGTKDGVNAADDARVTNVLGATIQGGDDGLQVENGAVVLNGGTVTAADKALQAEDALILDNSGLIESVDDEGVEAGDNADVTNTGTILGFDDALQVGENATILNDGTIANTQTAQDLIDGPALEAQDAIDIDSGSIVNTAAGVIRSTTNAAIDFDESDVAQSTIQNAGLVSGTIAVETDPANDKAQIVENSGTLIGTSGLALNLGGGDDAFVQLASGSITGGANFGAGGDMMTLDGPVSGAFGGAGALFDGGEDGDVLNLVDYLFGQVSGTYRSGIFDLRLDNGTGAFSIRLTRWEHFTFGDTRYTEADLIAAVNVVPLPAPVLMLGGALLALGAAARRRAPGVGG